MGIYFIFTLTKNSLTLFSHVKLPLYQSTSKSSELKIFLQNVLVLVTSVLTSL